MKYDCVVFIGRFQPFHLAHYATLKNALDLGKEVVVILGSSFLPRSAKNPFSNDERIDMIKSSLAEADRTRVHVIPIRDCAGNNEAWLNSVHAAIGAIINKSAKIALIGFDKDSTSFYLKLFPQWERIESPSHGSLNATDLRNHIFDKDGNWEHIEQNVPSGTFRFLNMFKLSPDYSKVPPRIDEHTEILFGAKDELIKRNQVIGILTDTINDLLSIQVAFISDESMLSDFLWGDTEENRKLTLQLSQRLGIEISRKDYLVDIADKMMLMSELKGSN